MKTHRGGPFRLHVVDVDGSVEVAEVPAYTDSAYGVAWKCPNDGTQVFVPWRAVVRVESGWPAEPDDTPAAEHEPVEDAAGVHAEASEGDEEPEGSAGEGKLSEWAETDPDVVRAWARDQGLSVKDSGPISKATLAKYAAAHSG